MYDKAMRAGRHKMMYAGTMESDVFERAVRRDPSLRNNKVFIGVHGGKARKATNEMEPPEVGRHIENLLNFR